MPLPIVDSVLDLAKDIFERVIPDPKQKAEALLKLEELHQSGDLQAMAQQSDINKIEAASANVFIAGWRPAIGWVCGAGFAMAYVVSPFVQLIMAIVAVCHGKPFVPPPVDMTTLGPVLTAMLGLAGLRSFEKLTDTEKNR